jgi:hypothetical protein
MNEWTVTTLKEHLDAMLAERDKQISLALTAAEKAVTKAETATEKRFDSVNEFRQTLTDQTKTFASSERVDGLTQRLDKLEGRSGGFSDGWRWMLLAIGIIIAAATYFK